MEDAARTAVASKEKKFVEDHPLKGYMPDVNILKSMGQPENDAAVKKGLLEKQNALDAFKLTLMGEVPAVESYVTQMRVEIEAFITRALDVEKHELSIPTSTTKEFLSEKYGTGEGVRKGTYLGGIATKDGPMYVTETR